MQKLHKDEVIKKYHLNDILLYKKREIFQKKEVTFELSLRETHSMMINERDIKNLRSRVILLSIYSF